MLLFTLGSVCLNQQLKFISTFSDTEAAISDQKANIAGKQQVSN